MSNKRNALLYEVIGLLVEMTDEQCKILLAATKVCVAHPELSPKECVELARREAAT